MNIRKMLARLNAKAPQYTIGSGGIPEFTPQDIAAALGMVDDVIGREIFCMAWWPDGGALTRKDLRDGLKNLLFDEYTVRHRAASAAKLNFHMLESAQSEEGKRQRSKALSELDNANDNLWPENFTRYGDVADTVVVEICAPKICKTCGGRGEMIIESKIITCEPCKGMGLLAASHSWRAQGIGVGESAYRSTWRSVYEWLYDKAARRESAAAQQLARALGDIEEHA